MLFITNWDNERHNEAEGIQNVSSSLAHIPAKALNPTLSHGSPPSLLVFDLEMLVKVMTTN